MQYFLLRAQSSDKLLNSSEMGAGAARKKSSAPVLQGRSLNFAVPPCFGAEIHSAPLPALYRERPADFIGINRCVLRVLGRPERFQSKTRALQPWARSLGNCVWSLSPSMYGLYYTRLGRFMQDLFIGFCYINPRERQRVCLLGSMAAVMSGA